MILPDRPTLAAPVRAGARIRESRDKGVPADRAPTAEETTTRGPTPGRLRRPPLEALAPSPPPLVLPPACLMHHGSAALPSAVTRGLATHYARFPRGGTGAVASALSALAPLTQTVPSRDILRTLMGAAIVAPAPHCISACAAANYRVAPSVTRNVQRGQVAKVAILKQLLLRNTRPLGSYERRGVHQKSQRVYRYAARCEVGWGWTGHPLGVL